MEPQAGLPDLMPPGVETAGLETQVQLLLAIEPAVPILFPTITPLVTQGQETQAKIPPPTPVASDWQATTLH